MSVTITSSQTTTQPLNNQARLGVVMGNGKLVTLVASSTTYAMPHVFTSGDNGATWVDGGALPSIPTTGPDGTAVPGGIRLGDVIHTSVQTIGGQEKLCVLFLTPSGIYTTRPGGCLVGYAEFWWDGSASFTSSRGGYLGAFSDPATEFDGTAIYDGTNWFVAAWSTTTGTLFLGAGAPGSWKPAISTTTALGWNRSTGTFGMDLCKVNSTTLVLACNDSYRAQVSVLPIAVSGTTLSASTINVERVAAGVGQPAIVLDGSSNQDIVYTTSAGTQVAHRKRTGTSTYGTATTLGPLNVLEPYVSALRDTSGDLWALYPNDTGNPVFARLHGSSWSSPGTLDSGTGLYVKGWAPGTSSVRATYLSSVSGTAQPLLTTSVTYGVAPSAPTGLTAGNVVGTTPTLSYTYVNTLSNDPQGSRQYQISHDAGTTIDYDSGQVTTSSTSISVPSGAGLSYGTPTYWRVRTWDSLSNGGSGTVGPYSSWVLITPVHGGTVTLTDIYSGGATSTTVIASPSFQPDVSWSQADSNSANAAVIQVYQSDGVTLIGQSSTQSLSPALASGGSTRLNGYNGTALTNGASVKVRVGLTDSVTGLVSWSSLGSYTVTYSGPAAPTGLTATPDAVNQVVNLAWTNASGAATTDVQMSTTGTSSWVTISTGSLITSFAARPSAGVAMDYRVRDLDSSGTPGAWATVTNITLPGAGGGLLLASLTDMVTGITVPLGIIDDETTLGIDYNTDVKTFLPLGSTIPKSSYGIANYRSGAFKWKIMKSVPDGSGGWIYGSDLVAKLAAMNSTGGGGHTLLYTDPYGNRIYLKMSKFHWEPFSSIHNRVSWAWQETKYP